MKTRLQYKVSQKKYKTPYIYIPKAIYKQAGWLKKQKVVEIEVDILGQVVIRP